MNRILRYAGAFAIFAALGSLPGEAPAQEKDKKSKWVPTVELGKNAGSVWLLKEAQPGVKIMSDRDYIIADLPEDTVGGTFLMRSSPELGKWLPTGAVTAKAKGTIYAIVLVSQYGKEKFSEVAQSQFEKDGWKPIDEKTGTTFPSGEKWEWKAYKKEMKKGDQILQLDTLSWDKHGSAVLYIFK